MDYEGLDFSEFHDASLIRLEISWQEKSVIIQLKNSKGFVNFLISNFQAIKISNSAPWGPSDSIYRISVQKDKSNLFNTKIELQSGDILEILSYDFLISK